MLLVIPPLLNRDYQDGYIQTEDRKNPKKSRRKKKPSNYWPENPFNNTRDEEALWRSVILQAIFDAVARGKKARIITRKKEAISWLTENDDDFIEVCQLAGLDHNYVRKCAKKAFINPEKWRTWPGQSTRYLERRQIREMCKQAENERGIVIRFPESRKKNLEKARGGHE